MSVRPRTWHDVAKVVPGAIFSVPIKQFGFVLDQSWRRPNQKTKSVSDVPWGSKFVPKLSDFGLKFETS